MEQHETPKGDVGRIDVYFERNATGWTLDDVICTTLDQAWTLSAILKYGCPEQGS
jgi:hypothetical protein